MRTRLIRATTLATLLIASSLGCGKKGPPLPPLEGSIPRISDLEVRQVGEETRAYFTMPIRPETEEVDYATTGVELWRRSAEPGASKGAEIADSGGVAEFTKSAELVHRAERDGLFDVLARERPWLKDAQRVSEAGLLYEYALVLRTNLRKRGTLSNVVLLEPVPPPPAPTELLLDPQESGIVLTWTAPMLVASLVPEAETPAAGEAEDEALAAGEAEGSEGDEGDEGETPPPETEAPKLAFNVYRAIDDRAYAPDPLNGQPVREAKWADADVGEGVTYRYVVRSVLDADGTQVLSAATEEVAFLYRDIFPPAVPSGLILIPQGGEAVNLIWNPNTERDLAGYGVYRREEGVEWVRLDGGGVRSAGFVDRRLAPGHVYEYAVTAFDGASPANESERGASKSASIPRP